jgi:hypothetical protein
MFFVYRLVITLHPKAQKMKDIGINQVTRLESLVKCQFISKCELVDMVEKFEKIFNINTIRIEACAVGTISLKILFISPPPSNFCRLGGKF